MRGSATVIRSAARMSSSAMLALIASAYSLSASLMVRESVSDSSAMICAKRCRCAASISGKLTMFSAVARMLAAGARTPAASACSR